MYTGRLLGWAAACASLVLLLIVGFTAVRPAQAGVAPVGPMQAVAPLAATPNFPFAETEAISKAVRYLQTRQQEDGGIAGFGTSSDVGSTLRALLALSVAGYRPNILTSSSGKTPLDFLESAVITYTYASTDSLTTENLLPGPNGLLLMGLAASGVDPTTFAGRNWITSLQASYQSATGAYSTTAQAGFRSGAASAVNQSLAILGLSMSGEPVPEKAVTFLVSSQQPNGSWLNNVDVTSYAVLALLSTGQVDSTNPAVQAARRYLLTQQAAGGLFGDDDQNEPANSTGWAMQALSAIGYLPATESLARPANPRAALIALQKPDGSIGKNFVNAYSTIEAIYGLSDQPLWYAPRLRANRSLTWLAGQQRSDGGWGFFGGSDAGMTLDAMFAYVGNGFNPLSVRATGGVTTALDFLEGAAARYTRDDSGAIFPAQTGKLIVGVVASGRNPNQFGLDPSNVYPDGLRLVDDLLSTYQPATGAYSSTAKRDFSSGAAGATNQAFAILGLAAAQRPIPEKALAFLVSLQAEDGRWGNVDTTGLVLQALVAGGAGDVYQQFEPAIRRGVAYLLSQRDASGGWGNANSTAYALQGLLAAGALPPAGERSPIAALHDLQKPDGPFVYAWDSTFLPPDTNGFATNQAAAALTGAVYPYRITGNRPFSPVGVGSDPNRLLVVTTTLTAQVSGRKVDVRIPFGSDLNRDATVRLAYVIGTGSTSPTIGLAQNQTVVITQGITRGSGFFAHTFTLTDGQQFISAQATLADPDRIERDGQLLPMGASASVQITPAPTTPAGPVRVYLPLVVRAEVLSIR
jgi:prenyltransferase beta subunit